MTGRKWVRVEPPEAINIRLTIKKDKYPEIYEWLSELPLGTITPEVRKALEYYIKSTKKSKFNPSEEEITLETASASNSTSKDEGENKVSSQSEGASKREKESRSSKDDQGRQDQDQDKERKKRTREILMRQLEYYNK